MKSEKLLYTFGNIEDKYIVDATPKTITEPKKVVKLYRKPLALVAVIALLVLLCAFTVYVVFNDLWNQTPSQDPVETVHSAIVNQIDKEYTVSVEVESIEIDEAETIRVIEMYSGSDLAQRRGWTDEYLSEHFKVIKAIYYTEYDHTKTPLEDGRTIQYFYLTQDIDSGEWTISDNTGNIGE